MGVEHLTPILLDAQSRSHITLGSLLEVSLQEQALDFAAFAFLLTLDLVERQSESRAGSQPSFEQSEF
jgi:hypothetical protein